MLSSRVVLFMLQDSPGSPFWILDRIVAVVGVVFGVAALVYAMIQKRDAEDAKESLSAIQNELEQSNALLSRITKESAALQVKLDILDDQTTTKAIAPFPHNLTRIVELITSANVELLIRADFCGYAMYSNPQMFRDYANSLVEACRRGVHVRAILFSYDEATEALENQFPAAQFSEFSVSQRFTDFFSEHGLAIPKNYREFRSRVFDVEARIAESFPSNFEIRVTTKPEEAFFWIRTNPPAAVFAHRNESSPASGLSFYTEDSNLANEYRARFESHWLTSDQPIDRRF